MPYFSLLFFCLSPNGDKNPVARDLHAGCRCRAEGAHAEKADRRSKKMPAGVAGTIILIFVLLPCRGDENDDREGERKSEGDEKEDYRGRERKRKRGGRERGGGGEAKLKNSYEGGKRKGWMSPSLHNLRQRWCSARDQGLSRKERFQLLFQRWERGVRERAAKSVLHFAE